MLRMRGWLQVATHTPLLAFLPSQMGKEGGEEVLAAPPPPGSGCAGGREELPLAQAPALSLSASGRWVREQGVGRGGAWGIPGQFAPLSHSPPLSTAASGSPIHSGP